MKSIAVPLKRRQAAGKAKHAGHPTPPADSHAGGTIGEARRQPAASPVRPVHRFRVGQRLEMARGGRDIARAAGNCQVVALVPHETGPLLYRVRSDSESFERVVDEIDLAPAR